ncbi:hypothetical protein ACG2LH_17175 [Zhouia sp. PK063]|uniref:hypothetical protein n=1 Tax=Zhouia sp. PK063 TaxID=3373602 RepID=UPI00379D95AF
MGKIQGLSENTNHKFHKDLTDMLRSIPLTYSNNIQVENLLALQGLKDNGKDEIIFKIFYQISELLLKMVLLEIQQLVEINTNYEKKWIASFEKMNHYIEVLIHLFAIVKQKNNKRNYLSFGEALPLFRGGQSVLLRYIEIYCTPLENLIDKKYKRSAKTKMSIQEFYACLYWRRKEINYDKKNESMTAMLFEQKYKEELLQLAEKVKGKTLADQFKQLAHPSKCLKSIVFKFDELFNYKWPIAIFETLDTKQTDQEHTGDLLYKKSFDSKDQIPQFFPWMWQR